MWLILILVMVGIMLLVAELVLLPGISIAGIGAFLAFLGAAFYGYIQYGMWIGSAIVTGIVLLSVLAVMVSLRANTWRKLALDTTIDSSSTPTPQDHAIQIGQVGETVTRLAPMGKVAFGDVSLEAKAIDCYIEPRTPVEAIGFDNTVVIVKAVNNN